MHHFLLFYKSVFYTFGFSVLLFAVYKYIVTKSSLVGAFLFFWASMTATAATSIVAYYSRINFIDSGISFSRFIVMLTLLLIAISLPNFVHKMFNIERKIVVYTLVGISSSILVYILLSSEDVLCSRFWRLVIGTIFVSNIYSFIVGTINVLRINNKKDRRTGLIFLITLTIHVSILFTSIFSSSDFSGFLYFPIFYMWIGGFNVYIALTRLKDILKQDKNITNEFAEKYKLTKREVEIAKLLVNGLTYKDIAAELLVSTNTVNSHVKNIYGKSNTKSKIQLSKEMDQFNS